MRTSVCISILLFFAAAGYSEEMIIRPGPNAVMVSSATSDSTILECIVSRFEKIPVALDGKTFFHVCVDGEHQSFLKGHPALPQFTRSLIIPGNAAVEAVVMESEFVEYRIPVAPSKGLIPKHVNPEDIPYSFSDAYKRDAFHPAERVELGVPYILRDFQGITVTVKPFAYNPKTRTLRIYTRLILEVAGTGIGRADIKDPAFRKHNRFFSNIYSNHFVNSAQGRYTPVDEHGRMIVICHGSLMNAIQPYVDWKRQKGIQTDLYDVAAIGTTAADIKDFIQDQYDLNDGLTFVQLVGDAALVPTFITKMYFFNIYGNSDSSYALLDGADMYPEIFVGRFSAETEAQLATQVERTVHYERDIAGGEWLHKGAGLGTVWGKGHGHNGWSGVEALEVLRPKLLGYTYTEVAQLYEEGTPPFYIIPVEAWEVTKVLHDGCGILNVDGNADIYYLDTGSYTIGHVDKLENDYELPFVYLGAPWAGNFVEDCFAEAWLRATNDTTGAPTGAVAVYTCSNALLYATPQCAMHETVDLLVGDQLDTFGGLMYNGACEMLDLYGATDPYETFINTNILGDASLQVRTDAPQAMAISHDPEIEVNQGTFQVSAGVEGALVCLSENYAIVASGYTDGAGDVTLTFTPFTAPALLTLTVTAYNKVTSIETVPVVQPFDALSADVDQISASAGGVVHFSLTAGAAHAGRSYLLLGSASGTVPGTQLPGGLAVLPLNWDLFMSLVIGQLNTAVFSNFLGSLDGNGSANAAFDTLGPVPGAAGLTLHFAYALNKPWNFASNAVGIDIVP